MQCRALAAHRTSLLQALSNTKLRLDRIAQTTAHHRLALPSELVRKIHRPTLHNMAVQTGRRWPPSCGTRMCPLECVHLHNLHNLVLSSGCRVLCFIRT